MAERSRSEEEGAAEKAADKIRRTGEGPGVTSPEGQSESANAHNELMRGEHRKGRPASEDDVTRSSNAGKPKL